MDVNRENAIQAAKDVLEKEGYYVGNLWHANDVHNKLKWTADYTDADALLLLDEVLRNQNVIEYLNVAISLRIDGYALPKETPKKEKDV